MTPKGIRHIYRLAGAVAVKGKSNVTKDTLHQKLTAPNATLADHALYLELGAGIMVFKSSKPVSHDPAQELESRRAILASLRKDPDIQFAQPVFVSPQTGLLLVPTEDIILRLRPEINPAAFFGSEWSHVRPLEGTTDQFILTLPGFTAEQILAEVGKRAASPAVVWAQPDFFQQKRTEFSPNDTYFAQQWALNNTGQGGGKSGVDVNAPEAWNITTGSSNVVIAILDDSVQLNHPDLAANIFTNPGEIAGNGIDDDANGYIDDVHGWDFDYNDNNPNPDTSDDNHGTCCTGIAAALGNNSLGVAGIAYSCQILPIKFVLASDSATAQSFYYAAGRAKDGIHAWRGADVISTSTAWDETPAVDDAINWAATQGRGGKGCPIFAAAGNDGSGWYYFAISNLTAGVHTFLFEYYKDDTFSDGEDTVWLDDVYFPGVGTESFEGPVFPPAGWSSGGNAVWTRCTRPDRVRGTGANSAQSGHIGNSQVSDLQVTKSIAAGDVSFYSWTSTEADYDTLDIYVDGVYQFSDSGGVNPFTVGISYPASHPDVVGVGASTDFGYRSDYSQYGTGLGVTAPSSGGASDIYTIDRTGSAGYNSSPGGDYYSGFGGTSAATPLAAGVGALVLSVNCDLTASSVVNILHASADKIGQVAYVSGWNSYYGYGQVDAYQAVSQAVQTLTSTAVLNPRRTNNTFQVSIQTTNCKRYTLQYKNTSTQAGWSSLSSVPGSGALQTLTDPSPTSAQRLYRVLIQ